MSAMPAFGHQVMYKVIMVFMIIIKVYHVVLLFFYFDMLFKYSFIFFNLCFVIQQILAAVPGADVQHRLRRWCCGVYFPMLLLVIH
jgi:hypothetical protein